MPVRLSEEENKVFRSLFELADAAGELADCLESIDLDPEVGKLLEKVKNLSGSFRSKKSEEVETDKTVEPEAVEEVPA